MQDTWHQDNPFYGTWKSQLYKGMAEMALMALLRREARYGLDMLKALREQAGMDVAEGSIYPILHRLEKAGFVVADWRHDADATHPRKYYALTDTGKAAFASMEREWIELAANLQSLIRSSAS